MKPVPIMQYLDHFGRVGQTEAQPFASGPAPAPFKPRTAWQDLLSFYARWRRSLGGASALWNAGGFVRHLQYAFELESPWALPGQLVRSVMRRSVAPDN